ncbi:MAG: 50S ribosomal protein L29 [Candidatus Blackburnbacteria bacterium RIFCSPHIGHO2_01_FULL_43_15b]|uniref:Large ribosomal subunit protein uL29 n=1 Tax=Candidatus Blackburnbacteria bacterium RIFCSPHIGHO2_01_FULL_43_15b TaxID=1797513 RepID=A0A1G1UYX6_9BACT|nr:MAG: 50S ribosomal protein L29 [Candidatus Blackburnbacteria bacterium RIFCSPHIGHO2_01_FULL_43_15b]
MNKKAKNELKEKSVQDLKAMVGEKVKEIAKTRVDFMKGSIKNVRRVKTLRDELARIKTFLNAKEKGGLTNKQ